MPITELIFTKFYFQIEKFSCHFFNSKFLAFANCHIFENYPEFVCKYLWFVV